MAKPSLVLARLNQAGMTLIEVLISTGLAGLCFVAIMFLLSQSSKLSGRMNQNFETLEGVTDAVSQFGTVIPQITRITSCLCRANTNSRASCIWDPGASAWYDPVRGASLADGTSLDVLKGEFEAYDGTQTGTSMDALKTSNISLWQACAGSSSDMANTDMRGCKLSFALNYTSATATTAGQIKLTMGGRSVQIGAASSGGARGVGVTDFACGFDSTSGDVAGSIFVMNIRVKSRSNLVINSSNPEFEPWYDSHGCSTATTLSNAYCRGAFREIQLKYTMRNLTTRGAYFWRPSSIRNCVVTGSTATSAAQCCSQAISGGTCATCKPAGTASALGTGCCSGNLSGGFCL